MRRLTIISFCLLVASALPAAAQNDPTPRGAVELSGFVGWHWFDEDLLSDDLLFGVRGGYHITENWQVEAYYDRTESDSNVHIDDLFFDVSVVAASYGLDALFNMPFDDRSEGYAVAGLGQGAEDFEDLEFFELGVGYRYFLNPQWALRGDLRLLTYDNDGGFGFDNQDVKASIGASFVLIP